MGRIGRALLLLVMAGAAAGLLVWAFRPRPITVETAVATEGTFRVSVEEDGKTRVRERYTVSAPVAGRVLRIGVKAGDAVVVGANVASILPTMPSLVDPRTRRELEERIGAAEAAVEESEARMERTRALVDQSRADLQRIRTLLERGVASIQQLEREELALRTNERDLRAATLRRHVVEHELAQARVMLRRFDEPGEDDRLTVTAPISGRVLKVAQESETVVAAGTPLIDLADPSDLEVVVDVLTTDAVSIVPGAAVTIERWGGPAALEGKVRLVEPGAFTRISALGVEEQRVWVVIDITSPPAEWTGLGDGYRVEARITVEEIPDAVTVPGSALFRRGEGWAAFVVEDGLAREREVAVRRRSGLMAAVADGLRPGERVVLFPPNSLQDGARLRQR